jgi:hypothetical protein
MSSRPIRLPVVALAAAAAALVAASVSVAASPAPVVVSDSSQPRTIAIGGAPVLNTTRTVLHWNRTTFDPHNGVTYGYNMVGYDPIKNQAATIPVDIIPLTIIVAGQTYTGADAVPAILASPQFQNADYSLTSAASTGPDILLNLPGGAKGPGGALSAGNSGIQLEDATMRAQFNKVGTGYHLILGAPVVHDSITISVPANHGVVATRNALRGVYFGDVDVNWFAAKLQNLNNSLGYIDPTHLPLYVTNDVMLFSEPDPINGCCIIGFHGAGIVPGRSTGSVHGNGNQPVQTYAWTSYITPGTFNPINSWAVQDIHALSHEIAEWADDPFVNNTVEPWLTPTAPQYGCTGVLETGDPVVGIGFSKGVNTFEQGQTPKGQQVADGTYHPEDEALLPWFMRVISNTISQPSQSSTNGRYTFMGDLNPFSGFRQPATGC